jgi:glycosyltransferase involved in cell wall biosynthesis
MRIIFYPVIKTVENLTDLYYRACWYLPDFSENEVVFLVDNVTLVPEVKPSAFGDCGEPSFAYQIREVGDNPEVLGILGTADFVLLWNDELNIMENYNVGCVQKYVLNVSKGSKASRHEAYHFSILAHELASPEERSLMLAENQVRFRNLVLRLPTEKAYVFGTGPSLEKAFEMDFSDGVSIISNTIVKNKELVDHIQPRIIVAGDPALHYGVSRYACEFRQHLIWVMAHYDAVLFMPMGYYPLFVKRYPYLKDRVFGIPIVPAVEENICLNLRERYESACYANVLTMLLLPIGTTLAQEVHIIGCDGRPPETIVENRQSPSPFWNHHKDSEQEEIYGTLKECHPSFFSMNYQDWYEEHCKAIQTIINKGEDQGFSFVSATPSYVPALAACLAPEIGGPVSLPVVQTLKGEFEYRRDNRTRTEYKVSLIVSIYNADSFIVPAMENLLSQTAYERGEMEIILIDSASPGNERGMINYYMDHFDHIFYGRTWERETVYGAFNRAIKHSGGKYIMNLDTDNRLRNDAVDIFAEYLDSHGDVGLVYGNQYVSQNPNDNFYNSIRFGHLIRPEFSPDMMLHKFYFGSELMWRRDLNDKVGLYDDTYTVAADYEMVCRYAKVTKFAHVNKFYGLYMKNLNGVEYSNLELCNSEDDRIRKQYEETFPKAVDPPRVHIHYPVNQNQPGEYLTIICHSFSYDKKITPFIDKLCDCLEFPHIIYCIDQNSSQTTQNSISYLIGEGIVSSADNLLPHARKLFESPVSYQPGILFYVLIHGKIGAVNEDFMGMKRPGLTTYFKTLHDNITRDLRDDNGQIDPVKVPTYCDHNELMRINLDPHVRVVTHGNLMGPGPVMTVFIQHYAPETQTDLYRQALNRCIQSVRDQDISGRIHVIVTDDGSHWSECLAPEGSGSEIHAYGRDALKKFDIFNDLDVDGYLYKRRTGYFSKGILWQAAVGLTESKNLVFLDDDHFFENRDCIRLYLTYLLHYGLVIGNTQVYKFRDNDGVTTSIKLGYDSPVVQGSNFGIHRDLLAAVGGFDKETFLWGTGDDPALFWKLYLQLRPSYQAPKYRACYVDDIVTHNPYSGRWRENCRLDIELFIRDFMRRFGVHPNTNPSRNRKEWVVHISSELPLPVEMPGVHNSMEPKIVGPELLSVIVPAVGANLQSTRQTVVSILDQNLADQFKIYVVAERRDQAVFADTMPRSVKVILTDATDIGTAVSEGLKSCEGGYKGWILPGMYMTAKTLQGSLSALSDGRGDIVSGGYCLVSDDGFDSTQRIPDSLTQDSILTWASAWLHGQPVFAKKEVFDMVLPMVDLSSPWDMDFLLKASRRFTHFGSSLIFSVQKKKEGVGSQNRALAKFIGTQFPGDAMYDVLDGVFKTLTCQSRNRYKPLEEWKGLPWYHALLRRNAVISGFLKRLEGDNIAKVAIYGAGAHTRLLLRSYWPRFLDITCILDDKKENAYMDGVPVINPEVDELPKFDGIVLSSKKSEQLLYQRCKGLNIGPVYSIYGNYEK